MFWNETQFDQDKVEVIPHHHLMGNTWNMYENIIINILVTTFQRQ